MATPQRYGYRVLRLVLHEYIDNQLYMGGHTRRRRRTLLVHYLRDQELRTATTCTTRVMPRWQLDSPRVLLEHIVTSPSMRRQSFMMRCIIGLFGGCTRCLRGWRLVRSPGGTTLDAFLLIWPPEGTLVRYRQCSLVGVPSSGNCSSICGERTGGRG